MGQIARDIFTVSIAAAPSAVAQFRGVDFTGAQITVAGQKVMGISKRPAAIGQPFEAAVLGSATVEAGAAFAAGVPLAMDASGRVIAATAMAIAAGATAVTSAAANGATDLTGGIPPQWVVGDSLEAASGAGDFVEVLLAR